MSLLVHIFRVWVQTPDNSIRYVELSAPCFDSAHTQAAPLLRHGELVFAIDQLTEL